MEKKRLTAVKTRIGPVISGKYIVQEGFEPNYVLSSDGMRLSRVRIMATVVDKFIAQSGKLSSITVDDGSGTIRAKMFNSSTYFDGVSEGDIVDVIGRVREYGGELFLIPEVVRRIEDANWEILRELEIREMKKDVEEKRKLVEEYKIQTSDLTELNKVMKEKYGMEAEEVEALVTKEDDVPEAGNKDKILAIVAEEDKGDGCPYDAIMQKSGLSEDAVDAAINDLIDDGSIFEPRPGKIKRL